ncbi:UbiD family decarboxylase [Hallerella porci]|uniref:4-hydroxy-3-polyprenylbenzoate decarboxylase n=1 Tax=Hallerella porci TaxID=1945871 RepID=A0ABX5LNY7_9BACT|nr:UbiD family decarboxylase [Hallerella porci]PWL01887.1 4-hydroxy-3-polyprenylbenzoate decarboxylase [Hallerella porci]
MPYKSLESALLDLEKHGMLLRISEEVSPDLLMPKIAEIATREALPALLFEHVQNSPFRAAANIFGTLERTHFLFRKTLCAAKAAIDFHANPAEIFRRPRNLFSLPQAGISALPKKTFKAPVLEQETQLSELPQIRLHQDDGGTFLTLPQVFSQMPGERNMLKSNLGMYRIQTSGNDYVQNAECGLHYQIERDIARHHEAAIAQGKPLSVSIWLGGPPAHTLAAIMPMPANLSELIFAGLLGGRGFRYTTWNGYRISADADFCILGEIAKTLKPEGPFGDHIGYYSAKHDFPYLKVKKVFCKKNAIYPFTTVGRPPQEDSVFGEFIAELVKPMVPASVPGIEEMNAVDAAGVHPLLLAIGRERYQPYIQNREPMELLKEANALLGFNQVSLSKYLFIAAREDAPNLHTKEVVSYFIHILERIQFHRDVHFQTETTIDTLDYSGRSLNHGSKVIFAAAGEKIRTLGNSEEEFSSLHLPEGFSNPKMAFPGALVIQAKPSADMHALTRAISSFSCREKFPLITIADDSHFAAKNIDNWLWVTFTRSDPAADIYGANENIQQKHWQCDAPLLIDARMKSQMQKPVEEDAKIESLARDILFRAQKKASR